MMRNFINKFTSHFVGKKSARIAVIALFVFALISLTWTFSFGPPADFPGGKIFTVSSGQTLEEISSELRGLGYIRSTFIFKESVRIGLGRERGAIAGDYFFEKPLNAFVIAKRIVTGEANLTSIRVTIPEGLNKFETAEILDKRLPNFVVEDFLKMAPEGQLFPDTYFFASNNDAEFVVGVMVKNFDEQIKNLEKQLNLFGKTLDDVIKMASIVETEARETETRKIIAGILWKRLEMNMPLQVDVSFKYINGKNTYELTKEDLTIDSPYNTYVYTGLPPTPVANPGLDSILASIEPTESNYLFFLSDKNGSMHYAETFEEHKENKIKYL